MLKITAVVAIMCIVSSVWAAGLSCDSCGSECAPACGTRRFRACCFNYLRKKRGPDTIKIHTLDQDVKESQLRSKQPIFTVGNIPTPEQWIASVLPREHHPYYLEDMVENNML